MAKLACIYDVVTLLSRPSDTYILSDEPFFFQSVQILLHLSVAELNFVHDVGLVNPVPGDLQNVHDQSCLALLQIHEDTGTSSSDM